MLENIIKAGRIPAAAITIRPGDKSNSLEIKRRGMHPHPSLGSHHLACRSR
jgi:hypothetical protein